MLLLCVSFGGFFELSLHVLSVTTHILSVLCCHECHSLMNMSRIIGTLSRYESS